MVKVNGYPLEHFYRLEVEEAIRDRRFRLGNYVRRFSIRNHQDAADYDDLMLAIFQHCIDSERGWRGAHVLLHHPLPSPEAASHPSPLSNL
jgi:hypothetical protein